MGWERVKLTVWEWKDMDKQESSLTESKRIAADARVRKDK